MSRKMFKYSALFVMLLVPAIFAGCGSDTKEGSVSNVARVSETACAQCHSTTREPLTAEFIYDQYYQSPHYLNTIGCQDCHGGGAQHNGVGPIPYPKPGIAQCATCHTSSDMAEYAESNHGTGLRLYADQKCNRCHSHEGAVLGAKAGFTGDKAVMDSLVYAPAAITSATGITCTTCHEMHGGKMRSVNTHDATSKAVVPWDPNKNYKADQFDLCTSCHTLQDNSGKLVASGSTLTFNDAIKGAQTVETAGHYHDTNWRRQITTTHYDFPQTGHQLLTGSTGTTKENTLIEGYVIRANSANPCFDCHGHEAKTETGSTTVSTAHTDWAKSAHANQILKAKIDAAATVTVPSDRNAPDYVTKSIQQVDAVLKAYTDDSANGGTWGHYDWDDSGSRGSCQRCHTATGAENFMKSPTKFKADGTRNSGYDLTGAGNSFTHLAGWTSGTKRSDQNEVLYCWGCHSNAGNGTLHQPGPFSFWFGNTNTTSQTNKNGVLITYPDASNSNVCLTCHSGRTQIAANIKFDNRTSASIDFINPHYMPSAAIVFAKGGYEFTGRSYAAPSYFAHDKIGISAANTGSSGPCVGCHMSSPNKHQFTNVTKNASGVITAITSTMCVNCHTGSYALTATVLEEEKMGYEGALDALKLLLAAKGIYYDASANPYFFNHPTNRGSADQFKAWKVPYGTALWKDTMGASYNLHVLLHDAGYVHNRFYSKRLIWDSIDFMYDGVMNNDVEAAINASGSSHAAHAIVYLGTTRP